MMMFVSKSLSAAAFLALVHAEEKSGNVGHVTQHMRAVHDPEYEGELGDSSAPRESIVSQAPIHRHHSHSSLVALDDDGHDKKAAAQEKAADKKAPADGNVELKQAQKSAAEGGTTAEAAAAGKDAAQSTTTTDDKKSSCFAGGALVSTANGDAVPILNLRTGDLVRTATGFEPVVGFLHAEDGEAVAAARFLEISTDSSTLPVTSDHLLFLANGEAVSAVNVKVGDILSSGVVTSIQETLRSDGLYAPLTKSGTIVVEGVVASTYASMADFDFSGYHALAHLAVAPLRWAAGLAAAAASPAAVSSFGALSVSMGSTY